MRRAIAEHANTDDRVIGGVIGGIWECILGREGGGHLRGVIRRHVKFIECPVDAKPRRHRPHFRRQIGPVDMGEARRCQQCASLAGAAARIQNPRVFRQLQHGQRRHRVGWRHIAIGVDQVGIIAIRPGGVERHQLVRWRV